MARRHLDPPEQRFAFASSPHFDKLTFGLKQKIYRLLLVLDAPIIVDVQSSDPWAQLPPPSKHFLAITAISRRMRSESLPIFYGYNTFRLITGIFKPEHTRPTPGYFDYESATKVLSAMRTERNKERQHAGIPALWTWFHQIGPENTARLQDIQILLGAWDVTHPLTMCTANSLPCILAPLVNTFKTLSRNALCTFVIEIISADARFATFHFPATDLTAASRTLDVTYREKQRTLEQGIKRQEYSAVEVEVLRFFFDRAFVAVETLLNTSRRMSEEGEGVDVFAESVEEGKEVDGEEEEEEEEEESEAMSVE